MRTADVASEARRFPACRPQREKQGRDRENATPRRSVAVFPVYRRKNPRAMRRVWRLRRAEARSLRISKGALGFRGASKMREPALFQVELTPRLHHPDEPGLARKGFADQRHGNALRFAFGTEAAP